MVEGGQAIYEEKQDLGLTLAKGTVVAVRDEAARCRLFSSRGPMSGQPSVSRLLDAIASGELRIVKVEQVEDVDDVEDE